MTEYLVIYEQGDDGTWGAYCPDLPVFAGAETRKAFEDAGALAKKAGARVSDLQLGEDFKTLFGLRGAINDYERACGLAWELAHYRERLSPQMTRTVEAGLAALDRHPSGGPRDRAAFDAALMHAKTLADKQAAQTVYRALEELARDDPALLDAIRAARGK